MSALWTMHRVSFLLFFSVVCMGQRQQEQNSRSNGRVISEARCRPSRALARFLLDLRTASAFNPTGCHRDFPVGHPILNRLHSADCKSSIYKGRHLQKVSMIEEQDAPKPFAQAAATLAGLMIPLSASAEEGAQSLLDTYKSLPEEVKQLIMYLAQTAIAWGVPLIGIGFTLKLVFGGRKKKEDVELPAPLAEALGFSKEPKEFLEIERLNEKLQSFDYSLAKATTSKETALRENRKLSLQQRISTELASFDLDADVVRKIEKAEENYRKTDEKLSAVLEKKLRQLRALPFKNAAKKGREESSNADDKADDENEAESEEEKEPEVADALEGSKSPFAAGQNKMMGMMKDPTAAEMMSLQSQITAIQAARSKRELDFLSSISGSMSPEQASSFAAAIKPKQPLTSNEPGAGAVDAFSSLEHIADVERAKSKHVWVLKFFGDVTASQVSSLRQEVTAVLRGADASRSDEVLIVLNTGGGTVTGYGLAAAQLTRIKNAGLKLTICVEQVAASGGYLMACVADKIVAAPFAVLGSIGVITEIPNVYERLQKEGIVFSTVTAGKYKRTLTPTKKIDPLDEKKTKEDIEQVLVLFKGFVETHRPKVDIQKVATGETWLGPDALAMDLVDDLLTVDEVLSTHIDEGAEVYGIKYKEAKKSPLAALSGVGGQLGLGSTLSGALPTSFSWQELAMALLARMIAPKSDSWATGAIEERVRSAISGATPQFSDDVSLASTTESFERRFMLKRPTNEAEPMYHWKGEGDDGDSWSGI